MLPKAGSGATAGEVDPSKGFQCVCSYLLKKLAKAFSCSWGVCAIKTLLKFCLMFAAQCGADLHKTETDSQDVLPSQEQEVFSD